MSYNNKQAAVWHNIKGFQVSEGGSIKLTIGKSRSGQDITIMFPLQYFESALEELQKVTGEDLDQARNLKEKAKVQKDIQKNLEKIQSLSSKHIQAAVDAYVATGMSQDEAKRLVFNKLAA